MITVATMGVCTASSLAADMIPKAAPNLAGYTWTGFYLGAHAGYGWAKLGLSQADRTAIVALNGAVPKPDGVVGGIHGGYNHQFPNRLVLGVALEINGFGLNSVRDSTGLPGFSGLTASLNWDAAILGRVGYAIDRWHPYILAGLAWDRGKLSGANPNVGTSTDTNWHTGWTVGGGIETALTAQWIARGQYRYIEGNSRPYVGIPVKVTGSIADIGLSYRF